MNLTAELTRACGPLYDETAAIIASRPSGALRAAVECCVFDLGLSSPMDPDTSSATDTREIEVVFPLCRWPFSKFSIRAGDLVEWQGGSYRVCTVEHPLGDISLKCREVPPC